jgi:L-threonylcarbamoyladenylate synthase
MTGTPSRAKRPSFSRAVEAIDRGGLVAYPTETVYGLGADAFDAAAVGAVFDAKGRSRDEPVSVGVTDVAAIDQVAALGERERAFATEFLPGPVTLVAERTEAIPDAVTAGGDRVGVRVPDHRVTQDLLDATGPLTATSANRSGEPAPTTPGGLAPAIREAVAVVVTPGGGVVDPAELPAPSAEDAGDASGEPSTVVDVARDTIHRRGASADAVADWLAAH